jgi:DNA-binding MarR family transcriptional regulator
MNDEGNQVPSPNRLVHEPARLAILTVLASCVSADFIFLQGVTRLSKGNLSVQLTNLEQAGLVTITKQIVDKKTRTTVKLSQRGAAEIKEYWRTMDAIRARMAEREKRSQSAENQRSRRIGSLGHVQEI